MIRFPASACNRFSTALGSVFIVFVAFRSSRPPWMDVPPAQPLAFAGMTGSGRLGRASPARSRFAPLRFANGRGF